MSGKLPYAVTRQNRKTVALYVRDGGVEVRAPLRMTGAEIDRFVESKREWILRQLDKQADLAERKAAFSLDYGSLLPYRGKEYSIRGQDKRRVRFDDAFIIPADLPPEQIKHACVQIYRLLARRDLIEKVIEYAAKMGVNPSNVRINDARTRWGSCSSKHSLNFSWRIVMADDDVIDYLVVHELAHIKELNHSARFWATVGGILPDYKERQARLKELQKKLSAEDWG
jgi:predicted metal-dependent hydrolase